jgi:hypothetical protein
MSWRILKFQDNSVIRPTRLVCMEMDSFTFSVINSFHKFLHKLQTQILNHEILEKHVNYITKNVYKFLCKVVVTVAQFEPQFSVLITFL